MKTVHRRKLTSNFTVLPNELLRDKSLSFRARGILAMMLSHSEDWVASVTFIEDQGIEGREAVRSAMKELEERGYLTRETVKNDRGHFQHVLWIWHDSPNDGNPSFRWPNDGNPSDGFTGIGQPAAKKNHSEEEPKKEEQSNGSGKPPSKHYRITSNWGERYQKFYGEPYSFSTKDAGLLAKFLKGMPALTVEAFFERAAAAWQFRNENQFCRACKGSATIAGLCMGWNDISAEINQTGALAPQTNGERRLDLPPCPDWRIRAAALRGRPFKLSWDAHASADVHLERDILAQIGGES